MAAYTPDPNSPVTPNVTNPLLQPVVTAQGVRVRVAATTPTVVRPYGYDAVAAINNFQAPNLSTTSGIFNWCVNTFVVRQNVAATPHRQPVLTDGFEYIPLIPESPLVSRQLGYNAEQGASGLYQTAVMYTDVESDCTDGGILSSTSGIRDWVATLLKA